MNKKLFKSVTAVLASFPLYANAVPVDLSTWVAEGGSSNWIVQAGNDAVLQTVNGSPTVFFDPSVSSTQGTALNGKIKVTTTFDDDFIGFLLGYDSGEITSASPEFFLVDWKQGNQPYGRFGLGAAGLSISRVSNASDAYAFWGHDTATGGTSVVTEIQRGSTLGATGWNDRQEYDFNILFNSDLIEVSVDGFPELSITPADAGLSAFSDGGFGFYNYSQSNVLYSSIVTVNCSVTPNAAECASTGGGGNGSGTTNVPEPSTFVLLGLGLVGLGFMKRRRPVNRS